MAPTTPSTRRRPTGTAEPRSLRPALRLTALACRLNPGWAGATLVVMAVAGLLPLAQVAMVRRLVNSLSGGLPEGALFQAVLLLVLTLGAANLALSCTPLLQAGFRESTVQRLAVAVYRRIAHLEPLSFERPSTLDRLSRVQTALDRSLPAWAEAFAWLVQSSAMTLAAGLLFARIHGGLVLLALLNGLAALAAESAAQSGRAQLFLGQTPERRRESYLMGLLTEAKSLRELLLFGAWNPVLQRWRQVVGGLWARSWRLERRLALVVLAGRLAQVLLLAGSVWFLFRLHARGAIDPGLLVGTLSALLIFHQALTMLVASASIALGQGAQARELVAFLEAPPPEPPAESSAAEQTGGKAVQVESVSFTYPGQREPALDGIDLSIRPGERVAIVGENGSGKSTLAKLLLGLYPPTRGRVLLNGVEGRLHPPGTRSAVFQLFQRYWLTIRDNLGFGYLPWREETPRLEAAARSGGFDLSRGLDAALGKPFGGTDLSGGQWQRLALSRGLLAPSGLLVLDEVTSQLDPEGEAELLAALDRTLGSRTVIFVAHRLPLARLADRIVVMQAGRIAETGSHAELLARGGLYARFYEAQSSWYRDKPS
ncbi:MAG: ABC transporter ATP-binding protein [Bacillota bacterium]